MLLRFKAKALERNIARFYTLRKSTNLWGDTVVSSSFGRIGYNNPNKSDQWTERGMNLK